MIKHILAIALGLGILASGAAQAAQVTVLPTDVGTSFAQNKWYLDNFRGTSNGYSSTTTAAITNANPRNGNGSVQMSLTDGTGKADYVYTWGFDPSRTLGTLSALSYDWYRSAASTAAGLQPAFRLFYDTDGNAATTADRGYMIWEQVYNPNAAAVVSDQWVSSDILGGNFWQRQFTPSTTIERYDLTLAQWQTSARPANGDPLTANTAILGIEFGIGSGWNGTFNGFVDNVTFGFGTTSTTFNFETAAPAAVPEPGSIALFGLGLLGFLAMRRKA